MAYNILIVDDSATTRAFLKRAISLSGVPIAQMYEADHGKSALALLNRTGVDLIFADLHMPEMDGVEMANHLHNNEALCTIPLVVVTADPNCDRLDQLKISGVRGVIRKPFTPESIRDVLTQVLGVAHG